MKFQPITKSIYNNLLKFYEQLNNPLSELNIFMMIAWQSMLDLQYCIDSDNILYVIGKFENEYWGWGPPIGFKINESHIEKLFAHLEKINSKSSSIIYLWSDYSLLNTLQLSSKWKIIEQASEYIYKTTEIAALPVISMKSFNEQKNRFIRKYKPITHPYSPLLKNDCIRILDNWIKQKSINVPAECIEKFKIEADVCRYTLTEQLPLSGVVVYINDIPQAFSIGGKHTASCFNCMFEKTNLKINGLSIYVFSTLAEQLKESYTEIHAGDDWGIPYLKKIKLMWQPFLIQKSYQLLRNKI